ncbi:DUF1559 family PulG-like putative transporter [Mariniblastus fucicola]|uniref:DUF1559 domain-containing protein n=1 Tax=Mariniblastus fucicola TaxID=980251 RepID=A0A5B9PC35_9BACT|nr:DUF1559 domain-containing protein [Mariniblastus fucicola]QEG23049.1 hypothetical protein MFFC18_29410 [Mariniblastus fucicola]
MLYHLTRIKTAIAAMSMLVALTFSVSHTIGQDANPAALKKFVTSDVIGIAYVDLDNMDLGEATELLEKLGFGGTASFRRMQERLPEANKQIAALKDAGFSRGYALLRTSDFQAMGTSFVFPLAEGSDSQKAIKTLQNVVVAMSGEDNDAPSYSAEFRDGAVIAAGPDQFDRLKNDAANDTVDRSDIWKSIDGGSLGVVLFGDDDSRKVVKELMPPLPGPFAKLDGELIADGTKWIGFSAKVNASPELKIEIEASDDDSAKVYEAVINDGLKMAKFAPQVREVIPKSEVKFVFEAIKPKRNGTRVTMSASELTKDLDRLAKVLAPQVKAARAAAIKTQTKNMLRQLILGMLNYESAHRHFPTQYNVDADGKPLLSWRVHILPFLNQMELYEQFNLEEPWDSEQNLKLVSKMPMTYWDPRGEAFELNKEGKTIFQVPAGEGLVFNAANKTGFGDLTDGSSNTISIVAMPPEQAVPWTKPVDWNVDLENPLEKLKAKGKKEVVLSLCDGSTHEFPLKAPDTWRRFIGPKDGEIVRFSEFSD